MTLGLAHCGLRTAHNQRMDPLDYCTRHIEHVGPIHEDLFRNEFSSKECCCKISILVTSRDELRHDKIVHVDADGLARFGTWCIVSDDPIFPAGWEFGSCDDHTLRVVAILFMKI